MEQAGCNLLGIVACADVAVERADQLLQEFFLALGLEFGFQHHPDVIIFRIVRGNCVYGYAVIGLRGIGDSYIERDVRPDRLGRHDFEIGAVGFGEIVVVDKGEVLCGHSVDLDRHVEADAGLGVDERYVTGGFIVDLDRKPAVCERCRIRLVFHDEGIGAECHVFRIVPVGLQVLRPVGICGNGGQDVVISRDDAAQDDHCRGCFHHREFVVALHSLVGRSESVGVFRVYEVVDERVLRIEIERYAQILAERIEARLGSGRVAFDLGGNGDAAFGEFEKQVVSAELLGRGGEIAHVPSVFSAFEHGFGLLLGGLDAFGSGFVEKILLVEQA